MTDRADHIRPASPAGATGLRVARIVLRLATVALGAAHTTVAVMQQSMNEDGIDYLDMGDAWLRGDWAMAVNGIWSPLYSWILGAVMHATEPSIPWEFPVVQITNFFIYVAAMFAFEFFWRELTATRELDANPGVDLASFHPIAWLTLGYSLFIWSSLNLIEIWAVNPDMCVAALVYLAAGLFLRLARDPDSTATTLALGLILGAGYLAKAAMMPLAIVLMLLTSILPTSRQGRFRRFALAAIAFLVIAGPFVAALSVKYGELTFSDVGRFTFLKHVNEMPYPNFHPALGRLEGAPEHPPRKIFDDPPIYEFAKPVGGTYAMSYDPGYWTAGLKPTVGLAQVARAIATQGMAYFDLFFRTQGAFLATAAVLLLMTPWGAWRSRGVAAGLLVSLWAGAAFGLYSLVHVTTRYIAPFVVLLWAGLLGGVQLPDTRHLRKLLNAGSVLLVLFVWTNIGTLNLEGLAAMSGFAPLSESGGSVGQFSDGHGTDHPAVAEAILAQGLHEGDQVAFVGYSFSAYWARLARLRIVAEVHPEDIDEFWQALADNGEVLMFALSRTGIAAVVAEASPPGPLPPGWVPLGETGYLIHRIK